MRVSWRHALRQRRRSRRQCGLRTLTSPGAFLCWANEANARRRPERRSNALPPMAEPRRQFVAAHRSNARRLDERAGPRRPVRRRDAEALVGEQHDARVHRLRTRARGVGALRIQDGFRQPDPDRVERELLAQLPRQARPCARPQSHAGPGEDPQPRRCRRPRLSTVVARLLPVRLCGDHADPDARLGARAGQLQGVDPVRRAVDERRLHRQRVPDLGGRLVRTARSCRLQRRLCDPPRGRCVRLRCRVGDRPAPCA